MGSTRPFDAFTFFFAAFALLFLHVPSPKRSDVGAGGKIQTRIWADVREGATYIWRRRPLLWLLGTFTAINFVGATSSKRRPVVVVSSDLYHANRPDVVLASLTTQIASAKSPTDYVLLDWRAAG